MRNRSLKLLPAAVLLVGLSAAVGLGTWAAFAATTTNAGDKVDSGTVALTDNDSGSAMFSLSGLKPGDTATRCIKVTSTGSLASAVRLYGTTTGTGLDPYVSLTVTRGSYSPSDPGFSSCTNFQADSATYVSGQAAGIVYAGTLANYPTSYASGIADPGSGASQMWTANESHVYKLQITVGDNRTAESKNVTQTFTWEAQNDGGYRGTILSTSGLQSYWRFGESSGTTASDQRGSVSGTYSGGFTLGQTGAIAGDSDTATSFNGSTGQVNFGDDYGFPGTAPFSAELWVKQSAEHATVSARVLEKVNYGGTGDRNGWLIVVQANDSPGFIRYSGTGTSGTFISGPANAITSTNGWHLIDATYDGTNMRLYVDGVLKVGPSASTYAMNAHTSPLLVAGSSGGGNAFPGLEDEVAIYNVALTAGQVDHHYHRGMGG